jgi:SAM-dependent methyltransferase
MSIESPKFEMKSEAEKSREETLQRYLAGLDLSAEQLRDKRILDLGCGEEGEFVKKLIDEGITKEIYGLDSAIKPEDVDENYRENILQGDFEAEFPVKDLDYVISVGAIDPSIEEEDIRDPQKTILSALESLKDGGEIRIFPIRNAASDSGLEGIIESRKKWLEILDSLLSQGSIEYEIKPIQTKESVNKTDKWIEEVLIIRKAKNNRKPTP